jgi:hypothetical protein
VDVDWFDRAISDGRLAKFTAYAGYRGLLAELDGVRWWRAAVDEWIWTETKGKPNSTSALEQALSNSTGSAPVMLTIDDPVLTYDRHGVSDGVVVSVGQAVRIAPQGWPAAAGTPWASKSSAKTKPLLRAIVIPEDTESVESP